MSIKLSYDSTKALFVKEVTLLLVPNSAAQVEVKLETTEPSLYKSVLRDVLARKSVSLSGEGGKIDIQLCACSSLKEQEGRTHYHSPWLTSVTGILSTRTENMTWIDTPAERCKEGLYQKESLEKESDADFCRRVFSHNGPTLLHLHPEEQEFRFFPDFGTVYRPPGLSNLSFLREMMMFLCARHPDLYGWLWLGGEKPLRWLSRFKSGSMPKLVPEMWQAPDGLGDFTLLSPTHEASASPSFSLRRSVKAKKGQAFALLKKITGLGQQGKQRECESLCEKDEAKQLLLLPTALRFGQKEFFCQRISYTLSCDQSREDKKGAKVDSLELEIELGPLPHRQVSPWKPRVLEASFKQWSKHEQKPKEKKEGEEEKPTRPFVELEAGIVFGKKGVEKEKSFCAFVTTPLGAHKTKTKAGNTTLEGVYIRRRPGERLLYQIEPGEVPRVLGQHQHYHEVWEKAEMDFVVNTAKIGLSVSASKQEAEKSSALLLDAQKNTAQLQLQLESGPLLLRLEEENKQASLQAPDKVEIVSQKELRLQAKQKIKLDIEASTQASADSAGVNLMEHIKISKTGTTMDKKLQVNADLDVS